jgi:hypothetical protein
VWDAPFTKLSDADECCDKRNSDPEQLDAAVRLKNTRDDVLEDRRVYGKRAPIVVKTAVPAAPAGRFIDRLDSATRKQFPMATGLIDYAPDALAAISHVSWVGNEKHNKGEPLHHARGKSSDHADCQVRHLSTRLSADPAYKGDPIEAVSHLAQKAWRAIIELQEAMEKEYALDMAPGAWYGNKDEGIPF